ncbi:MAG TPA: hypothetical protein VK137_18455, partial [Planctomycetaceae bacterium]|nr:hypothetical protein [Planctomycetaceae bacterium]
MKRIVFALLLSVVAMALAVAQSAKTKTLTSAKPSATNNSPPLVRVNGHAITEANLQFFARTRKLAADDVSERRDTLIERLIERHLLREFLAKQKIAADPKLLDEHLTRLKQRLKAGKEDPNKVLAKAGFTDELLRRELSLPLDWDAYVHQVVTDAKLREVWKQRKHEFDGSEVRAAHIVLKSNHPDDDEKTLRDLRGEIISGRITFA